MRRVLVIGFSGPDGSGKTSLVNAVACRAAREGVDVHRVYLYGCVACRHLRVRGRHSAIRSATAIAMESRRDIRTPLPSCLRRLHANVDTVELLVRFCIAYWRGSVMARRGRRVVLVLADRTPLDALVKHDLPAAERSVRALSWLAECMTIIALLDAPGEVLSERDVEHCASGLEVARAAYRRWSKKFENAVRVSTEWREPECIADELVRGIVTVGVQ